jgi:hypothetical protein
MVVLSVLFLIVLLILFGDRVYAHLRMGWVNNHLFQVAEQLGYTPDALLRHEVKTHDFVPPINTICDTKLYFTTTLSASEFKQRVVQVLPDTGGQGWSEPVYLGASRCTNAAAACNRGIVRSR